ncbi:unnamed protein product [Lepidochelys kempii]
MACISRYTVRLQMVLEKVALELEDSVSDLGSAVKTLNKEVQQLRTFSLQNRLALDHLLASQGGVCTLVGPRCCVYVNDSSYEIYEKVVQAEAPCQSRRTGCLYCPRERLVANLVFRLGFVVLAWWFI